MTIYVFSDCAGSSLLWPAFSRCGEQGLLFVARPLVAVAALGVEHRLQVPRLQ